MAETLIPVTVDSLGNDLFYKAGGKRLPIAGYNDAFWHTTVKPERFKQLGIVVNDEGTFIPESKLAEIK